VFHLNLPTKPRAATNSDPCAAAQASIRPKKRVANLHSAQSYSGSKTQCRVSVSRKQASRRKRWTHGSPQVTTSSILKPRPRRDPRGPAWGRPPGWGRTAGFGAATPYLAGRKGKQPAGFAEEHGTAAKKTEHFNFHARAALRPPPSDDQARRQFAKKARAARSGRWTAP
jgi:hypothetical protein